MRFMLFVLVLLGTLSGCDTGSSPKSSQHIFIQHRLENAGIQALRSAFEPRINAIIKEELGVKEGETFPLFLMPKMQNLTLYSVSRLADGQGQAVLAALDSMQVKKGGINAPEKVSLSNRADFFGEKTDEIVVLIDDTQKELHQLHDDIRDVLHGASKDYHAGHKADLYDIKKSEHFAYVPHIAVGRIQIGSIKAQAGDGDAGEKVVARIKDRIKKEIFPLLDTLLNADNKQLKLSDFIVFQAMAKKVLKTYSLATHTASTVEKDTV